jgi:hypothetical protein
MRELPRRTAWLPRVTRCGAYLSRNQGMTNVTEGMPPQSRAVPPIGRSARPTRQLRMVLVSVPGLLQGSVSAHLLEDADRGVGDDDEAEQPVLPLAGVQDDWEQRDQQTLKEREEAGPNDLADSLAGAPTSVAFVCPLVTLSATWVLVSSMSTVIVSRIARRPRTISPMKAKQPSSPPDSPLETRLRTFRSLSIRR